MFTINTFSISKLNNAEVTGFYINVQKAITTADASKLGLSEVMTPYGTTLEKLIDQVYTTTGSEFTAAMLEADVKRDQTYKRIRLRLQMVEVAEDNPSIKAVKDVVKTHLLAKYTSKVPQLPYQEESAILQGFIYDLNDKLGSNGINALGISDDMAALEDANDSFIAAYNQRATERAEGDTGLTLKLRQEMYAMRSTSRCASSPSTSPTRPRRQMPRRPPLARHSSQSSTCCSLTLASAIISASTMAQMKRAKAVKVTQIPQIPQMKVGRAMDPVKGTQNPQNPQIMVGRAMAAVHLLATVVAVEPMTVPTKTTMTQAGRTAAAAVEPMTVPTRTRVAAAGPTIRPIPTSPLMAVS